MRLDRAFLLLNLALVLVSVCANEAAAEEYLFLLLTCAVCGLVWHLEARGRSFVISDSLATLICGGAFIITMLRGLSAAPVEGVRLLDVRVPAISKFLIVFQWVYLFRRKAARDYFWIYLVSVIHMGTAGLLMPGILYGLFLLLYAAVGVSALAVYHVWIEVQAAGCRVEEQRVGWGLLSVAPLTLALMFLVACVFTLLPRKPAEQTLAPQLVRLGVQPVAGFSSTVRLGDIGTIQDNPQRVMRIVVRNPDTGEAIQEENLLLRGIALETYAQKGDHWDWQTQWHRPGSWLWFRFGGGDDVTPIYAPLFPGFGIGEYRRLRCDIELEPLDRPYLFVPFAAERLFLPRDRRIYGNIRTHAIVADGEWRSPLNYSVVSRIFSSAPGTGSGPTTPAAAPGAQGTAPRPHERFLASFLALPENFSPRVVALARQLAPERDHLSDYEKAQRILSFLSDASRFTYTTEMAPSPGVEPVEDFLFNRRAGHCEYFASAMVLMLRCVKVPARLVNGFKVVEWNPLGGHYVVRQSNAHSWVEAYLHPLGWRTFDPSVTRDAATPRPTVVRRWWRNLYDTAEALWVRHVLNYDATSQEAIYGAIAAAVQELRRLWLYAVLNAGGEPLSYSWRQVRWTLYRLVWPLRVVLTIALAVLGACFLAWAGIWFLGRLRNRRPTAVFRFYARMERLLAQRGFPRQAWQTPWEFHAACAAEGRAETEAVALITQTFCRARYGGELPSAEEMEYVARALESIRKM